MAKKDITYKQFVAHMNEGNKAFDQRKDGVVEPEPSVWITANDMKNHMDHMKRQGYKYHIDE